MRRRLATALVVLAVLAAACGDDDTSTVGGGDTETTGAEGEKGRTVTVEVDGKSDEVDIGNIAYFPDAVTVHPGDTVEFHSNDTGEPHTVTFGTLVDEGLGAGKDLPPDTPEDQLPAAVKALDEKLPPLLPEGPGDANQLSANPCFVAAGGELPADTACPKTPQPAFDGKHLLYNSGYLPDDATFEVQLAKDLAPGTYNFFCLLHRQGMTGAITVVPEGQKAQSADEVKAAGDKKLAGFVSQIKAQNEGLADTPPDQPIAGAPPEEGEEGVPALLLTFNPEDVSVPAGSSVTWSVFGPHTVSVNPPEDAVGVMVRAPDGTFHANEKALAPTGGPGAPPPSGGEPSPDAKPILIDGGRFDGSGFRSSGFIPSFGPPGYQYKLTFTKAGTYEVRCQVHPDMEGTVKVT
jgi:plastocyanin